MLKRELKDTEKFEVNLLITLLKRGENYNNVLENFLKSGQKVTNVSKYLEDRVMVFLNEENDSELYDFVAKTCEFPTFKLAKNIAMTKLNKKEFIKVNKITQFNYEVAYDLFQKVPMFVKMHEDVCKKLEEVNSRKMHMPAKRFW